MSISRFFGRFARLNVFVLLAVAVPSVDAVAQTDTAATSIKKAVLTAFRDHPNAARSTAVASRQLVLDPIVLPFWYDNGVRRETLFASVVRDSAQSALLASALGTIVASRPDAEACTPAFPPTPPAQREECKLLDVVIVSVGEPRPVGSEAALMVRTTSPVRLANGSITLSRYGSTYRMRLTRVDGRWRVRCMTNLPDTRDSDPARVAERCGPP